ncbi:MAG TPA: 30S ribosomal protein S6 [Patescibacteria group bacterium]|nr:30S ribosomal protein S6 [Patescibacteria group bacterium]
MKQYEITFIVSENYNEDKAKSIAKEVRELIESRGGKIEKDVFWGKRKLAYKIAKNTFGYYFVFVFVIDSVKVNSLNRDLNLNEKIMRYLIGDYIENTSFFEEVGTKKKEGGQKPDFNKSRKQEINKSKKREIKEEIEEVPVEKVKEEAPEIKIETPEVIEEPVETKEEIEETKEKIPEEISEKKLEEEEIKEVPEIIEEKKEVKEEKEEEEQPKRKKMTDDERKAALDAKLAELLKDEE